MYMWLWDYALALLLLACMLAICNHYNELDREEQEAKYKTQEDEEEGLENVKRIYNKFMGSDLTGKALPEKNEEGCYKCSTTGKKQVFFPEDRLFKTIKGWKNTSNFAMKHTKHRYARVYVAYEAREDKSEYTWFIRMMEIESRDEVDAFWEVDALTARQKKSK